MFCAMRTMGVVFIDMEHGFVLEYSVLEGYPSG